MTITKSYKSHTFGANKICDIPVNLGVRHYSGKNYYMWDAAENYWSGHEWDAADPWQPTVAETSNDGYPKSKATDGARWRHEGSGAFEASVNPLFNQLPNANEMAWYVRKGDAHWDNTTWWEVFGELHTNGIWLKKLSVIALENGKEPAALKQADPHGKDIRMPGVSDDNKSISPTKGKPADSEIGNYFFLPALGSYAFGSLSYFFGSFGQYWSSSANANSQSDYHAFDLLFCDDFVTLVSHSGVYGFVAMPFE